MSAATPSSTTSARELRFDVSPRYLAPGNVVRMAIEGIGVLENRISAAD